MACTYSKKIFLRGLISEILEFYSDEVSFSEIFFHLDLDFL